VAEYVKLGILNFTPSHLSRAETTIPINTQFVRIDYVGEMKRIVIFD